MTTETKLLPCPFCGGEAELDEYCGKYVVFCKNSSCSWRETKEQAVETWNTRYKGLSLYRVFPHIYWTKRNPMETLRDKIGKLDEEFWEVVYAKDETEVLDETLDVLHCCVEILREFPPEIVEQSLSLHNAKNRKRGYYEPRVESE